ncbi:MAG TPA: UrcA family protein [Sphingomicrobium sp.]
MLSHYARLGAAVLSGVTASLLIATAAFAAGQQDGPVVVYAEPLENVRTERVSYADLDLSQARHERRLNLRVAGAVKRVCLFEDRRALQTVGYNMCADEAWEGARPQIAQAVARARDIAFSGKSSIAATAITLGVSR